jgi:hypothetical protein
VLVIARWTTAESLRWGVHFLLPTRAPADFASTQYPSNDHCTCQSGIPRVRLRIGSGEPHSRAVGQSRFDHPYLTAPTQPRGQYHHHQYHHQNIRSPFSYTRILICASPKSKIMTMTAATTSWCRRPTKSPMFKALRPLMVHNKALTDTAVRLQTRWMTSCPQSSRLCFVCGFGCVILLLVGGCVGWFSQGPLLLGNALPSLGPCTESHVCVCMCVAFVPTTTTTASGCPDLSSGNFTEPIQDFGHKFNVLPACGFWTD